MQNYWQKVATLLVLSLCASWCGAGDVWIDVRTDAEYQVGHLPEATNIPHADIAARIGEVVKDKDTTIHLYCRSGRRSSMAQEVLQKQGFTHVINEGGYDELKNKKPAP